MPKAHESIPNWLMMYHYILYNKLKCFCLISIAYLMTPSMFCSYYDRQQMISSFISNYKVTSTVKMFAGQQIDLFKGQIFHASIPCIHHLSQADLMLSSCSSVWWEIWLQKVDRRRLLHISILQERCQCLIVLVWAAASQLSQDRCPYLFLHANKTLADFLNSRRWLRARFLHHLRYNFL